MILSQCFEYLETLKQFCKQLDTSSEKITYIEEDIHHSYDSFIAKDAIKDKAIIKKTHKFAQLYFAIQISGLAMELIQVAIKSKNQAIIQALANFIALLQSPAKYSFNHQEPFKNPYPEHLFFSQQFHASHLSSKSQRDQVAGKSINELVSELKQGDISPDKMRVNVFFASLNHQLHPFAYNNRTWVMYSRAGILPNRIVPIVPTQELLNRIKHIHSLKSAQSITEEPGGPITKTLKPL